MTFGLSAECRGTRGTAACPPTAARKKKRKSNNDANECVSNDKHTLQPLPHLVPLLVQFARRRALGKALGQLEPLLGRVAYQQVKRLKVEPREVLRKLQLPAGYVLPHGPAQLWKAAVSRLDVARHLAKVVQTEFRARGNLQQCQTCYFLRQNKLMASILFHLFPLE